MKKIISALLISFLIFSAAGCGSVNDTPSIVSSPPDTSIYVSSTDSKESVLNESIENPSSSEETQTETDSSSSAESSEPQSQTSSVCNHTFSKKVTAATCTTDGFTEYTCTKCGYSYIGDRKPAAHDYGKYFCLNCGKLDPQADKYWALIAWIDNNGQLSGNGHFSIFPYEFAEYSVSVLKNPDDKFFYIDYYDRENDIDCWFYISDDDICSVHYSNGKTYGKFDIGKSTLYKGMKVKFDDFFTPETENKNENVIAEECSKCIDNLMLHIEKDILYPKLGLKMSDFGFVNYK